MVQTMHVESLPRGLTEKRRATRGEISLQETGAANDHVPFRAPSFVRGSYFFSLSKGSGTFLKYNVGTAAFSRVTGETSNASILVRIRRSGVSAVADAGNLTVPQYVLRGFGDPRNGERLSGANRVTGYA